MEDPNCSEIVKSTQKPSLLMLTDACLKKIFALLELTDFVNLAKGCRRLKSVAKTVRVHRFTDIYIELEHSESIEEVKRSEEEFADKLSVIGRHLVSICIQKENDFILETINKNCKNLSSFKLRNINRLPEMRNFSNVKGLIIRDFGKVFTNNREIESIELNYGAVVIPEYYIEQLMTSLQLLPKLKSLELPFDIPVDIIQQLLYLPGAGLTKLSFRSDNNCNYFLMKLATKFNLLELKCDVDIDEYTFDVLRLFRNLDVLCTNRYYYLTKTVVLPPRLKFVDFNLIRMEWGTFVSIVKQLKYLEEFQLNCENILDGKTFK